MRIGIGEQAEEAWDRSGKGGQRVGGWIPGLELIPRVRIDVSCVTNWILRHLFEWMNEGGGGVGGT